MEKMWSLCLLEDKAWGEGQKESKCYLQCPFPRLWELGLRCPFREKSNRILGDIPRFLKTKQPNNKQNVTPVRHTFSLHPASCPPSETHQPSPLTSSPLSVSTDTDYQGGARTWLPLASSEAKNDQNGLVNLVLCLRGGKWEAPSQGSLVEEMCGKQTMGTERKRW